MAEEPEVALVPLQPPEAVQLVTLLELQDNVLDDPAATDVGYALNVTEGTLGGGGGGGFEGLDG